nr:phospholipid carrier-dependent glycosyltransferase [Corynebacterium uropygiale]
MGPVPRRGRAEWVCTLVIALAAIATRFFGLAQVSSAGTPIFDEKHYVPQAWDMVESQRDIVLGGIESNPGYGLVVHPPLGKQLIALGEMVFGYTPMGWRVMVALFGCATVFMIMALARQLSASGAVAIMAGVLATCDGVLLITARFGLLDGFQVFFIVAAAWALARDVRQCAARLRASSPADWPERGPRLGYRWWRFTAGVFLGLALSVKWSGLYYIVFFGLFSVGMDAYLRRRAGVRKPVQSMLLRDAPAAIASLAVLPGALYLWSWRAWFSRETSVYRHAMEDGTIDSSSPLSHLPHALGSWLYYHFSVLKFHSSLTSSSGHSHPWDSKPWSWLVAARPVLYSSSTSDRCWISRHGCHHAIYLFGTPAIWWLTVPVILWALWRLVLRRRLVYLLPLVGFAAGFLPWLASYDRQMYFFYAAPLVPFTICLLALAGGRIATWGRVLAASYPSPQQRYPMYLTTGGLITALYLALVIAMFLYFSPILFGYWVSESWYQSLLWLPSWQ